MNTKENLLTHAGHPIEDLPEDFRRKVESDPKLYQTLQDQATIATLLKLKTYEVQDPAMEGRVLHRVGVRIRNGEHLRSSSRLDLFPDWARMVAVVMVMLGLSVLTHREMLQMPQLSADNQTAQAGELSGPLNESAPLLEEFEVVAPPTNPFSPVYVTIDGKEPPNFMTPEFSRQLETSFLELGLDLTNRVENVSSMPVSYGPLR